MTKKYVDIDRSPYSLHDIPSFGLLRTNPKLSTNARIMTNGEGIWLESFNAHETLANESYKHFRVSPDSIYNRDLAKFYADTDYSLPYVVGQEYSDMGIKDRYSQQYETMYWYGCEYIDSLEYDEEMGLLAPLWIGEQFPDYFVIFRIDDPSYLNMKEWLETHTENDIMEDMDFKRDILDRCDIVSCFDLRDRKSPLGTYLHNYISQTDFPPTPLEVSVERTHETTYCGIDIVNGGFKRISEMQHPHYFEIDEPITDFDSYTTFGFERHRLACANVLNIEFLFNDRKADEFRFTRYFGLYCNKVGLERFTLDFDYLYTDKYLLSGRKVVSDKDGVLVPVRYISDGREVSLPVNYTEDGRTVQWLADRSCVCFAESRLGLRKVDTENNGVDGKIRIVDKEIDLAEFAGFTEDETRIEAVRNARSWDFQQIYFDIIGDIPPLVRIELRCDGVAVGHIMTAYKDDIPDDDHYVEGWQDGIYFCGRNSDKSKLARMVKNAFRSMGLDGFDVYCYRNRVIISTMNSACNPYEIVVCGLDTDDGCDGIFSFNTLVHRRTDVVNYASVTPAVDENDEVMVGDDNEPILVNSVVGDTEYAFVFTPRNQNESITVGADDISVFDHKEGTFIRANIGRGFCEVTGIAQCLDNITVNEDGVITDFTDGMKYIVLVDGQGIIVEQDSVSIYRQFIATFGVLSFFPLKDFDTYTSEEVSIYGDMGELALELDVYSDDDDEGGADSDGEGGDEGEGGGDEESDDEDSDTDSENADTTLPLRGTIHYSDERGEHPIEIEVDTEFTNSEVVCTVTNAPNNNINDNNINPVEQDDAIYEIEIKFKAKPSGGGGSGIDVDDTFEYPSLYGDITSETSDSITNEYDRYYENYNAESCLVSKVVPYIGKWVQQYKGNNVREKRYRHLPNNAFGEFNFSPSVYNDNLDPKAFTQEWMYIMDRYPFAKGEDYHKGWSYLGFTEKDILPNRWDGSVVDRLLSVDGGDFFTQIFSCDTAPVYGLLDNSAEVTAVEDSLSYRDRWSIFSHGTDDYPSVTYFHGIGIEALEKTDESQAIDNNMNSLRTASTGGLNGYRFSAVIVPTDDYERYNLPLQIVRNDKFKFICVVKYVQNVIAYRDNVVDEDGILRPRREWGSEVEYTNALQLTRTVLYNYPSIKSERKYCTEGNGVVRIDLVGDGVYDLYAPDGTFMKDIVDYERNTIVTYNSQIPTLDGNIFKVIRKISDTTVRCRHITEPEHHQSSVTPNSRYSYIIVNREKSEILGSYDGCIFSNIFHVVNTEQKGTVRYHQVGDDGVVRTSVYAGEEGAGEPSRNWNYCIHFLPRIINAKYNYLVPTKSIASQSIEYVTRGYSISRMVRNGGFYEPLFRDILYFKDAFTGEYMLGTADGKQVEFLRRTRGAHTEFAWKYEGFGLLPVLHFHRVNGGNTSTIQSANTVVAKKKLMPLANIVPFGTRYGVNVFGSNFDPYYYTLTINTIRERFVHGTSSMAEHKSFLGSKQLALPDEISADVFDYSVRESRTVFLAKTDVVASTAEKKDAITFSVNGERILRKSLHESLRPEMEKWVAEVFSYGDKETIDDDIDAYINENLLKLYRIKDISLWVKDASAYSPVQDYSYFGVDDTGKYTDGLRITDDVTKGVYASGGLNTKLVYNIKKKKNYCFGMSIVFERR